MIISHFRQAHIYAESHRSSHVSELLSGEFDLMLLVSSWDARCITITQASAISAKRCVVVLFDLKDSSGFRDSHDVALQGYAENVGRQSIFVTGNSTHITEMWRKLRSILIDAFRAKQRPLRVLIDISTCPRVYSTAVLAAALGQGLASHITLFYSQGEYAAEHGSVPEAFTAGRWRTIVVPGLHGLTDPGKKRFYLISVGFEGSKTYQAVSEADPYRVSLLFPDPGYAPEYTQRAWHVNEPLIREYCIPQDQIVRAPAGDAVAAWAALAASPRERPAEENTFYVCCGTKPHAIAFALRAMALRYPAVLYYVPGEHRVVATKSSGVFWKYEVRDLSALA